MPGVRNTKEKEVNRWIGLRGSDNLNRKLSKGYSKQGKSKHKSEKK